MNTQPDATLVLDYIHAFRSSKIMFTAVQLGIFDELHKAPQTSAKLASKLKLDPLATQRLLDACVALRLLDRDDGIYQNTAAATRYLVSSSPQTLSDYIRYSDRSLYRLWTHLDDAVREGTNRWEQAFGSKDALFDYYYRDPDAMADFLRGMHGFGQLSSSKIVRVFDLSRFAQLADLGGGTGHLAIAACEAYPNLQATVVDLPRIEVVTREYLEHSPVRDRISFVARDFFADPLPPADLYSLGRILHDWDDERIHRLLQKIYAALPSGGGLLIAEALLDDNRTGPPYAYMQDVNMLVCTEGRERTSTDYRTLLESAGFVEVRSQRTGSVLDALLSLKS